MRYGEGTFVSLASARCSKQCLDGSESAVENGNDYGLAKRRAGRCSH